MFKKYVVSRIIGWLLLVIIPTCHIYILWNFWSKYKIPIDINDCTCSCWDSIFKGPYEGGIAHYKHFYFNATKTTIKIWIIIVTGLLTAYECIRYLICLLFEDNLRFSMFILFFSSLFPHYYSWWVYINYYNDGFYDQWQHQLFFTITEVISTILVLDLANRQNEISRRKVMVILAVSIVHIYASGIDQFFINVFYMEGYSHQVVRDFGLMVPDILHGVLPVIEYYQERRLILINQKCCRIYFVKDLILMFIFIIGGCFYVSSL